MIYMYVNIYICVCVCECDDRLYPYIYMDRDDNHICCVLYGIILLTQIITRNDKYIHNCLRKVIIDPC